MLKHKNHSTSWSLATRVLTTISTNIVGHVEFHTRLFKTLDVKPGGTTMECLKTCESDRLRSFEHTKKTKCCRSQKNNDKIKEGLRCTAKDKTVGVDHGSGIGCISDKSNNVNNGSATSERDKRCPACRLAGHSRQSHRSCLQHESAKKKAKVSDNGGEEETTKNAEQAGVKIPETNSSMKKNEQC